jgi:peptidoglycan hydrolase CwlO-like protein
MQLKPRYHACFKTCFTIEEALATLGAQTMATIETELKDILAKFEQRFDRLDQRLDGIQADLTEVKVDMATVKAELTTVKEDIRSINFFVNYLGLKVQLILLFLAWYIPECLAL